MRLDALPFLASSGSLLEPLHVQDVVALIDPVAAASIRSLLSALPFPVHTGGYECRLGSGEAPIDGAVAVLPGEWTLPDRALRALVVASGSSLAWARVNRFLAQWSRSDSLARQVPFACIGFDAGQGPLFPLPLPCISLCVDPDFFARRLGPRGAAPATPASIIPLVDDCHRLLCGSPLRPDARSALLRLSAAGDVEAKHVSFMLPRSPATVKLDVRVRVAAAPAWLRRAGWNEAASAAEHIAAFRAAEATVQLNLVLGEASPPLLEVECFTGADRPLPGERAALLAFLVARGLCTPHKADALLHAASAGVVRSPSGDAYGRNWYAKVRLGPDGPRDAKAYFALTPLLGPTLLASRALAPAPAVTTGPG